MIFFKFVRVNSLLDYSFIFQDFQLLICILRFTSLLIEHSFSRHLYNSMEHLLVLLESNDMSVVLEVLNLLYMFSKRSNFITRLKPDEKECLLSRLQYLAEVRLSLPSQYFAKILYC